MAEHDNRPVRVLLVEDDEDDFVLTRDLLAESRRTPFELQWVATYSDALAALEEEAHDVVLVDLRLGDHDGLEVLEYARGRGVAAPLILLTGQGDGDVDLAAMRAGAADYLVKGKIDAQLLERSIRYALEQRRTLERLTHDAFHDALTQLPNRALFMDRLQNAMERHRRTSGLYAVLFLDLDRFKVINDSLGHGVGDELLVAVARRLAAMLRASDTIARLGGDEFAMLVEGIEHDTDAVRTAQRIQEALAAPFAVGPREIFTTVSIGIALSTTGYERPQDVLRDADLAMYRAKTRGKACHEVFDRAMHDRAVRLLQLETDLRRAVDRAELRVHYQPIIDLRSDRLVGFEALARWERGDVTLGADEFIPLAEETGLILSIGEWVLDESLRQLREWRTDLQMHVNLSPKQLLQPNLVDRIETALRRHGVSPRKLHLEITESVLIENAEAARGLLGSLRDANVGLSLDDFGTGYSSLSSLRQFPFDVLKIDRSFLLDADTARTDEIVRTVSRLARVLGMHVTVEGLETADQVERMRSLSVDYAQGFHFARPMPACKATEFLAVRPAAAT